MKFEISGDIEKARPLLEEFVEDSNKELEKQTGKEVSVKDIEVKVPLIKKKYKVSVGKVFIPAIMLTNYEENGKLYLEVFIPIPAPKIAKRLLFGKAKKKMIGSLKGMFKKYNVEVNIREL